MNNKKQWYDNPDILTTIILIVAVVIIVLSQSMAVNSDVAGIIMLRNLFNHNFTYIAAIIYFTLLKTQIGRRNFNIINVFYICLYILNTVAGVFTIFQSFSLSSILTFLSNILILCYMCFTFLKDTRIWKDFNLDKLPFDEIKNDWYFNAISSISLVLLLINLINVDTFYGIITTTFDTIYIILFARYIYLYKEHNDNKEIKPKQIEEKTKKTKSKKGDNNE